MAIINITQSKTTLPLSSPMLPGGKFNIDSMYQTQYINDLWEQYPYHDSVKNVITEGQQVYITEGSKWIYDWSQEPGPPSYIIGTKYDRYTDLKKDIIYTTEHKGEIWVLVDITNISKPIYALDIKTLKGSKQEGVLGWRLLGEKSLKEGSDTSPHLIWSSDGWSVGKIKIDDTVPEENKIKDTVLSFDGTKVVWKTLDTTSNLPTDNREAGNVLTVGEQGNLIWSSISQTEIEAHGNLGIETIPITESYTISNKNISANIYSKEAVDNMLSWDMI